MAAGTVLQGTVHVEVDAPVQCNGLHLELRWFVNDSTRREPERCRSVVVFEGHWAPGSHAVPFAIHVPSSPLTIHTKVMKVDWDLTARADIPWSIDPEATLALEVVRDPKRPRQRTDLGTAPGTVLPKFVMSYMLGLMAIGMGGMATYITGLLFSYGFSIVGLFIPVGLLFVGVGVHLIWTQAREQVQRARLTTFEITVPSGPYWPGDAVDGEILIATDARVDLLDVSLSLRREAWVVVRGHDNKNVTRAASDDVDIRTVWPNIVLTGASPATKRVSFTLPFDAVPTTCSGGFGVRWYLQLEATLYGSKEPLRREVNVQVG